MKKEYTKPEATYVSFVSESVTVGITPLNGGDSDAGTGLNPNLSAGENPFG